MISLFAKSYEETKIVEETLKIAGDIEKRYYINILDNLNIGFFATFGSTVHLYNKFITNLMKLHINPKIIDLNEDSDNIIKTTKNNTIKNIEDIAYQSIIETNTYESNKTINTKVNKMAKNTNLFEEKSNIFSNTNVKQNSNFSNHFDFLNFLYEDELDNDDININELPLDSSKFIFIFRSQY
jgi:hypothetical protein